MYNFSLLSNVVALVNLDVHNVVFDVSPISGCYSLYDGQIAIVSRHSNNKNLCRVTRTYVESYTEHDDIQELMNTGIVLVIVPFYVGPVSIQDEKVVRYLGLDPKYRHSNSELVRAI